MASICDDGGGRKRVLFVGTDGKRHAVRLGKATMKQAESFKLRIEQLVSAGITGIMDDETARWTSGLDDVMHRRLSAVGLVRSRARSAATLGKFMDEYFASLSVKPGTVTAYSHTRECLLAFFGDAKALRDIEPVDAETFRQYLRTGARRQEKSSVLADSTVARRIGIARQMFRRAVKWKLIRENPFAEVRAGAQANKARMYFVTREQAAKVIAACPDAQWRLLFALSRFGGLRCPSEHLALKWADVNWEQNRIRVSSPKTEHHEGMDYRYVPLFPELRPFLLEAFDQAEYAEYVLTRYRSTNVNLRTQLNRIIRRAGLKPWPKLFHNLRSSRQTELAETYPIHVVCAWIGNSRAVAQEHYLQVTDAHFEHAARDVPPAQAAQNQAQSAAVQLGNQQNTGEPRSENRPVFPSDSDRYDLVTIEPVGAEGFEPSKA